MIMAGRERRRLEKSARLDRMRNIRVVEFIDYGTKLNDCPIEVSEGYIVSDIDDWSVFASFIYRNASGKNVTSLKIRLLCYSNQNIPYLKIPFEYCYDDCTFGVMRYRNERIKENDLRKRSVSDGDTFGECVYIPLPESYFTKLELELMSVCYDDGTECVIKQIAGHSKARLGFDDWGFKAAYNEVNIYREAELAHPAIVEPEMGTNAWLCCCGHKNSLSDTTCENCMRDRDWQLKNIVASELEQRADEVHTTYTRHDNYDQGKFMESDAEAAAKAAQYEKAIKNIAAIERDRERRRKRFIPKLIAAILAVYGLARLLSVILNSLK